MKYAAAEYNIIFLIRAVIENISLKKMNVDLIILGKFFCLVDSRLGNVKGSYRIAAFGKKTASFPSPQPMSSTRYGLTGGRIFMIS